MVEAGLAEHCEVQIAYAIGVAQPVSVMIDLNGNVQFEEARLVEVVRGLFDLRPLAIIERLDLRRPIYKRTAAYGHFGRNEEGFTWEETDLAEDLKHALA